MWLRDTESTSRSGMPALPQVNPQLGIGLDWGNQCVSWRPQNNGKIFSCVLEASGERRGQRVSSARIILSF